MAYLQAYQILSNEQLRKRYDAKQDVSSDTDLMASGDFFAMLFGSMRFEEFVGELMISSLAREGGAIDAEKVCLSAAAPYSMLYYIQMATLHCTFCLLC